MAEYGMVAFGRSGDWELTVDELLGDRQQWCLQIESPIVSFQCGIPNLAVFAELEQHLASFGSKRKDQITSVEIGVFYDRPVIVRLDSESTDRCFIIIGNSANARFEVILADENYIDFRNACSQVVEELKLDQ